MKTDLRISGAAALLAGGKSQRMGRDKCLLLCEGVPLWQRQLDLLARLHPAEIFISARAEQAYFQASAARIIVDQWPEAGPLGGIASLLGATVQPFLLVLAVDLPFMSADLLQELLAESSATQGAVFQSVNGFEPLAAVYPRSLLPTAIERLTQGQLRMQDFLHAAVAMGAMKSLPLSPLAERAFRNLNTPEEARDLAGQ